MINDEQLKQAGQDGEKSASKALSVLAKRNVSVSTFDTKKVNTVQSEEILAEIKSHAVVAYTQAVTGVSGASILSMERTDALDMVDLFNNRPKGTTVVMQELDRSTVRETLNILSNSYVTELAKIIGQSIMLDVPKMITQGSLEKVLDKSGANRETQAIFFGTKLNVAGEEFQVKLNFLFFANENNQVKPDETSGIKSIENNQTN
jgi:chemotaxis protein CheY-P-specific phosphatase CheC